MNRGVAVRSRQARGRIPRLSGLLLVAMVAALAAAWAFGAVRGDDGPPPLAAAVDPLLPDLAMGPIEDVGVGTTENGDARLRFAATFVNLGDGEFLLRGSRSLPFGDDWVLRQRITERGGGHTEHLTGATLVFGGDGHEHWHVKDVEAHQLETPSGEIVGRLVKEGFCFFDTHRADARPEAPAEARWDAAGCGGQFDTGVRMGLSIGWGDKYPWHLLDERIDITGVPDGEYVIRQIADPSNAFRELDETNNETWIRVELFTHQDDGLRDVRIVGAGPALSPGSSGAD